MKTIRQGMIGAIFMAAIMSAAPAASAHKHGSGDASKDDKPWSQADEYYDPQEMAKARVAGQKAMGGQTDWFAMTDRLEAQIGGGEEAMLWDGQGWYGGDINKLWIKTEGEYSFDSGEFDEAEAQALWSRAITRFFDFQAGVRHDFEPAGKTYGVVGVQGLAPYWFEVDAAAFISEDGDLTARIEAEYELLLTQRLILQPRAELNLAAQDVPELEIGGGVSNFDAGLRLRYEIIREFAPYIGVEWRGSFGDTAGFVRAAGGDPKRAVFVAGLRAWF